jgi:phosphoglycerate dehydrogenase-like enzyme
MSGVVVASTDMPFCAPSWQRFEATTAPYRVVRVTCKDRAAFRNALADAEIAFLAEDLDEDVLAAPKLKWDSQFCDTTNSLVSPLFSAPLHDRLERTLSIIGENVRRHRAGEAILNALTAEEIYTSD